MKLAPAGALYAQGPHEPSEHTGLVKQAKTLERWVDEIMLCREIPLSLMEHVKSMHEQLIRQLFRNIDEDDSGLLDKDEVRLLASKLGTL